MLLNIKSKLWLVFVLLLTLTAFGCGGSGGGADTTAPTVLSTTPANGATDVSVGIVLSATFSEAMDAATIDAASFTLTGGGGSVTGTISYAGTIATFTPAAPLAYGTVYTATVTTTVTDAAGNALVTDFSGSFTTEAAPDTTAPTVSSVTPLDNATGVAIGTNVTATFDEAMDAATITATSFTLTSGGGSVTGTVSYAGTTATFTPGANLDFSTEYTATVTTAVTDVAGNNLASDETWSFTTASAPDTTAPTVDSVTPLASAVDVAVGTNVTATFDETMDAATITATSFTLTGGGGSVTGTVSYAGTTATFNPNADLASSTVYTATVTTAVTDVAGNNLASNETWTFTTADVIAPTVTGVTPLGSATDVAVGTNVTATFSEAMDAATITATSFTLTGGGGSVTGTVSYAGTTATFNPNADLASSTVYTATVTTAVTDVAGNNLASNETWTFTTEDAEAPTVSSVTPLDSAVEVAIETDVTATFSEAMDAATITATSFTLEITGGASVTGTVSYAGTTATFDPDADLDYDTEYTATVTTAVTDVAGNNLASNETWTFTTEPQTDIWSWIDGSDTVGAAGDYSAGLGNIGVPGSRYFAADWTDSSAGMWLFGGEGSGVYMNDLWLFDGDDWTWESGSSTGNQNGTYTGPTAVPGARRLSVSWIDGDDTLWLFGGEGYGDTGGRGLLNDLWSFNGTSWVHESGSDTVDQFGVYADADPLNDVPGGRRAAGTWFTSSGDDDYLWLFGGNGYDETDPIGTADQLNDLWQYHVQSDTWTFIAGSTVADQSGVYTGPTPLPGARRAPTCWTDSAGNLWMFGGLGRDAVGTLGELSDLWMFDGANWNYIKGSQAANQIGTYTGADPVPGARYFAKGWTDSAGDLWMFGGLGRGTTNPGPAVAEQLSDLWVYSIGDDEWTSISGDVGLNVTGVYANADPTLNVPGGRHAMAGWIDLDDNIWLFGGNGIDSAGAEGNLNDLWMYRPNP